jgi:hypothetical protein
VVDRRVEFALAGDQNVDGLSQRQLISEVIFEPDCKLGGGGGNGLLRHQPHRPIGDRRGVFDVHIASRLPCHLPDPVSALIGKSLSRFVMKELIRP